MAGNKGPHHSLQKSVPDMALVHLTGLHASCRLRLMLGEFVYNVSKNA